MSRENHEIEITVTFRHTESTPALKSYVEEKITHCLQKYVGQHTTVQIILAVEKSDHIAEAKIHSKIYDIFAKGITHDLYSAIDKLVDNIDTQLRKQKERISNHKHQSASQL